MPGSLVTPEPSATIRADVGRLIQRATAARLCRVPCASPSSVRGRSGVRSCAACSRRPNARASDGRPLVLVGVAARDIDKARAAGIPAELLTDAPAHLVADPEIDVVVELMGGDEPARTLIAAALGAGKPVVTANKHVIAHHGPELEAIARRAEVPLRFEAAVGGGIPVLGPLAERPRREPRSTASGASSTARPTHILTCDGRATGAPTPTSWPRPRRRATRRPTRAATSRATTRPTSWSSWPVSPSALARPGRA